MFDISRIDWTLLRGQKAFLMDLNDESADGIVGLLDSIQAHAVDVLGMPESEVFGETDEGED